MSAPQTEPEAAPITEKGQENDQLLYTALKKLKMDSERACAVTKEAENQVLLKHKRDTSILSDAQEINQEEASNTWSRTLQNLCLCDLQPDDTSSEALTEPLYYCHRHRRQKTKSASARNSLNFVHAAGVCKPIIREAKLKFPGDVKNKQMLRASHLHFGSKGEFFTDTPSILSGAASTSRIRTSSTSLSVSTAAVSAHCYTQQSTVAESGRSNAAFLSTSTDCLACFSSLSSSLKTNAVSPGQSQATPLPRFAGFRDSLKPQDAMVASRRWPDSVSAPDSNSNSSTYVPLSEYEQSSSLICLQSSQAQSPSEVVASAARLDLTMERSCSQEARLDEMSVNELAAYFEDFIHIPKKMSSMAEMMYT